MQKSLTRRLVLALVLSTLSGTGVMAHADTTTPPSTPKSVTGTDPVPTSPHVVSIVITWLESLL